MSFPATIDLPSPTRGGIHYTTHILRAYLYVTNPAPIRADVETLGFYLAKGESDGHESITLEKLKSKFELVLSRKVEKRKNSWANNLNFNLIVGNDKAIASMLASLWRRLLSETSLKKAELSAYGYALNGNNRSKSDQIKDILGLCEWCNQEINVRLFKGFTCDFCGVYFENYEPQKAKIDLSAKECIYEENYDDLTLVERVRCGELSINKTRFSKAFQLSLI